MKPLPLGHKHGLQEIFSLEKEKWFYLQCHELKASENTFEVRVFDPTSFKERAEIRTAYFYKRHQRGNLMSQMSYTEEEAGLLNLIFASRGNRPTVATIKAIWYLSDPVWPWECPGVYEILFLFSPTGYLVNSLCRFTVRALHSFCLFVFSSLLIVTNCLCPRDRVQ